MKSKYFLLVLLVFLSFKSYTQIINIPDSNFKNALVNDKVADFDGDGYPDNDADTNNDGEIQQSEADAVVGLTIQHANITSMEGIDKFVNLLRFNCAFNQLTNLDVSQNLKLIKLYCSDNQITHLDLSQNKKLRELYCIDNNIKDITFPSESELTEISCARNLINNLDVKEIEFLRNLNCGENQLTTIDISHNLYLEGLNCRSNLLSNINLKNGNNTILRSFDAANNPDLICIQVDNIAEANNKAYWTKETSVYYNVDCTLNDILFIPDDNFKMGVLRDADVNGDGEIQLTEAQSALEVTVQFSNIKSLIGIEYFTNLETLWCFNNDLEEIDVSKNTKLKWLWCRGNSLNRLNITQNTELERLICYQNYLTELDLSNNSKLQYLECGTNPIKNLDVSNNPELKELDVVKMEITSLDVSQNLKLETLSCWENQIQSLDVTNNTALKKLTCFNNDLRYLNANNNNNSILEKLFASQNPNLNCIQVDNVDDANSKSGWLKDDIAEYSEECATLSYVDLNDKIGISVYPNPVFDKLFISGDQKIKEIMILSLDGKLIQRTSNSIIDFSDKNKGVYFLKIISNHNDYYTQKVIKY